MNIPASALELLAQRWELKINRDGMSAHDCLRDLRAVLLMPNSPRDVETLKVALEIFGKRGVETLADLQSGQAAT